MVRTGLHLLLNIIQDLVILEIIRRYNNEIDAFLHRKIIEESKVFLKQVSISEALH